MKKIALSVVAVCLGMSVVSAQENYATAWSGHKHVVVNTVAAGTVTPVTGFPLLVRLDSTHASIFTQAKAGGVDLRFTKLGDVVRLPHQIEMWDATARKAALWVLVDTIPQNRNNFAIRLHWGNAGAADSSSPARVFDTASHFQAVWHLSGTANESDATANAFTATQNGAPSAATGIAGGGRMVSNGNYFRAGGTATGKLNFAEGSNYTVSAWVWASSLTGHGTVLSKHDNAYALKLNGDGFNWEFFEYGTAATSAGWNWVNAPADGDMGVWKHLVGVRSPLDVALYVNGQRLDAGFSTAASEAARVENTDVTFGAQPVTNTTVRRPFDGILDEVRLASAARSPDWIRLEYETQRPVGSVVRVLDTVPASLAFAAAPRAGFSFRTQGEGLAFTFEPGVAARVHLTVRDLRGTLVAEERASARDGRAVWDGRVASGRLAPQGVYAVRLTLLDARGAVTHVLERNVALAR